MKKGFLLGMAALLINLQAAAQDNGTATDSLYIMYGEELGEVVVKGRSPQLVAKLDRKVFRVEQDLAGSSGSAADLMQHIPSVDVDLDGTVSLRGNENVIILIDGKPSAMMGTKTRGDALNQLSASSIERIEVITNPSAAYKPDGVGGIINIVLKQEVKQGVNGSLTANAGSNGRRNVGLNLSRGWEKISLFGGYAYRRDRYDRTTTDHRESPQDFIDQETYGVGRPVSHTFRLGLNVSPTEQDHIEAAGSYNRRQFQRNEYLKSVTQPIGGGLADSYSRERDALARENMWEATAKYAHRYGKEREWGFSYAYSSESEDELNHYATVRKGRREKNDEAVWDANYLHVGKLYWQHRVTEGVTFSSGYELECLKAEQNYHLSDWDGTAFVPDTEGSSDFTHRLTLNSLYTTAEINLCQWNLQAGLRAERADIRNRLHNGGQDLTQHYYNIYPTLHLSHSLAESHELLLSYSLRVRRPEGSDMNPFAERINPLSLEAGNPDLKPEKIHSAEAGWLWRNHGGGSLTTTLYYRYTASQITELSRYIADGVLLTTKENLQSSHSAGIELVGTQPVARWLDINFNLNGYYNQIDASRLGFSRRRDTFSWSALLNANLRPTDRFTLQLNGRFRSATLVPQGRQDEDLRINLGMKYDLTATGLSVIASVTDLFDTYRKSYTLDTPQLKQQVKKRRNPRIIYVGLSWQFGSGKGKRQQTKPEYDEGL